MKIELDEEAQAAYICLTDKINKGEVKKTISLNDEIILDFDKSGKLLGIEVLNPSKYLPKETLAMAAAH